jgi:PAS domain S-box-containing protein
VNKIFEALEGAADGAFVVDEKLRFRFWNKAAENMLDISSGDVLERFCYRTFQGSDEEGHLICTEHCLILESALKSEPISNYDICINTIQGEKRWLNMSVIAINIGPKEDNKLIIHLFRDITRKKSDEMFFRKFIKIAERYHKFPIILSDDIDPHILIEKLTRRQKEVLTLLARGFGTREIADNLSITPNTARNHIQQILQKLQVHSRLEAVSYALNNGLLD